MKRWVQNLSAFLWGGAAGLVGILVVQAVLSGQILRAAAYLIGGAALFWALRGES